MRRRLGQRAKAALVRGCLVGPALALLIWPFTSETGSAAPPIGPGLPSRAYSPDELFRVISQIKGAPGQPEARRTHGRVTLHNGYLATILSVDGGNAHRGLAFYDISNPYAPRLVHWKEDEETAEIREAHGYGSSSGYGGDYVALQAARGVGPPRQTPVQPTIWEIASTGAGMPAMTFTREPASPSQPLRSDAVSEQRRQWQ